MRGKQNTVSVSTNSNVSFCGTYGCSNLSLSSHRWVLGKWMSKNPNFKSNDDNDEEDDDDDVDDDDGDDDETLRRGCCVKRLTRHMARNPFEGGRGGALIVVVMWLQLGWFTNRGRAWNWTFIAERRYLDPKRGHPTIAMVDQHLVYLKSHLEVYCVTHASCGEKKKHGQC